MRRRSWFRLWWPSAEAVPPPTPSDSPAPAEAANHSIFDALIELAEAEQRAGNPEAAADIATLAREIAPRRDIPEILAALPPAAELRGSRRAAYHIALGQAHHLAGRVARARTEFERALAHDHGIALAHDALSTMNMPGPHYYEWLARLYDHLAPRSLVEIGVCAGGSFALVPAETLAIGIDPAPRPGLPLGPNARLYAETSDDFFAARRLDALLAGRPLDIGFIDGLHRFEQTLRDFTNLEAHCGPRSVILIHDTIPFDEVTQRRERATDFWTGDVWRVVPCLKAMRPDLRIATVATRPSGLSIVTGLDPGSTVLARNFGDACARFGALPYTALRGNETAMLDIVPNDWNAVEPLLRGFGAAGRRAA